jgi:hypothetical protein
VLRLSDATAPEDREFCGHARFDVLAGDLVWLNCIQFDDGIGKYINQNWTGWVVTGTSTETASFQPPGFNCVRLSGVSSVELRCPAAGCERSWEVGLLVPSRCPEHDEELGLYRREFEA